MKNKKWITGVLALFTVILVLICSDTGVLRPLEQAVADLLYSGKRAVNNSIKIIAIEETSEAEYGYFTGWGRMRAAELVNALTKPEGKPAVIGFDINFITERDEEGDVAFAEAAARHGSVVTASRAIFSAKQELQNGKYVTNPLHLDFMEYPYAALRSVSSYGFTDTMLDTDNYVRRSLLGVEADGKTVYSFAYEVYATYMEQMGREPIMPSTDENGTFGIHYIAAPESYEVYAWSDVVNGKYDPRVFEDAVVLVGAYMPGMQDSFFVPIARGSQMYGVEIHANIVDALCREYSYEMAPRWEVTAINLVLCLAYFFILRKVSPVVGAIVGVLLSGGYLLTAVLLYTGGWYVYPVAFVLSLLLMLAVHIFGRYLVEWFSKQQMLKEFKKYVAPQVLAEMNRTGELSIKLGGESREIAVLFVDIRGFTKLSEELEPEQVVEMLNEYLTLTTEAIFANGGTLDKFIGDATMAVFNAPVDLPDYKAKAVQAALDIVHGTKKMNERIKKKIGREVELGVGVNCGMAVVGNIGCETRMDYTAIGDTVNTASRLEGKALGGQVVISETLRKHLEGRIVTEPLGAMELKGKAEPLQVYSVLGFAETKEKTEEVSK